MPVNVHNVIRRKPHHPDHDLPKEERRRRGIKRWKVYPDRVPCEVCEGADIVWRARGSDVRIEISPSDRRYFEGVTGPIEIKAGGEDRKRIKPGSLETCRDRVRIQYKVFCISDAPDEEADGSTPPTVIVKKCTSCVTITSPENGTSYAFFSLPGTTGIEVAGTITDAQGDEVPESEYRWLFEDAVVMEGQQSGTYEATFYENEGYVITLQHVPTGRQDEVMVFPGLETNSH